MLVVDQATIAIIFGLKRQQDVSRYLGQAREGLTSFVNSHIGPNVLTRDQWIRCNTNIAVELFAHQKLDEHFDSNINDTIK